MLILFIVFIVQFSVSCACLAISKEQQVIIILYYFVLPVSSHFKLYGFRLKCFVLQNLLLEIGWNKSESMQRDVEKSLDCCDFEQVNFNGTCEAVRTIILLLFYQ